MNTNSQRTRSRLTLVVAALLGLCGLWMTCERKPKPAEVVISPAIVAKTPVEPKPEIPVDGARLAREALTNAPAVPAAPPAPVAILRGTIRVIDERDAPLKGVKVVLTIVPHEPERPCANRSLSETDERGTTTVSFTSVEAVTGFALSAEQLEEHAAALAQGYKLMPVAAPPADADTCLLTLEVQSPGHRKLEQPFEFSIKMMSGDENGFACELKVLALPHAPMLHLTVIDGKSGAPVPDALVKYYRPEADCIVGRTDVHGIAQQILGFKLAFDGSVPAEPPGVRLERVEGIPLEFKRTGQGAHVSVEKFPDYAPGFYFMLHTVEFDAQADINETVTLNPRQYFSLHLLDGGTGSRLAGEDLSVYVEFQYHIPNFPANFVLGEFGTAQIYPTSKVPIAVGLDRPDLKGMILMAVHDRSRGSAASNAHFVLPEELPAPGGELTVTLNPLPKFLMLVKDQDSADQQVVTDCRITFHGSMTSGIISRRKTDEFDFTEAPNRIAGLKQFPLGAINSNFGWDATRPDVDSLQLTFLRLNSSNYPGYAILGPDQQVLAPWSDGEDRGKFVRPLELVANGLKKLGEQDGTLTFYVRRTP